MWSRRRFLEIVSGLPVVGGLVEGTAAAAAQPPQKPRDYFRELGVRPFINAAGTYTAMTASLMPPEVVDAITYASKHYVMLDELHDKVGERIAALLHSEAAMVTSGAASALTLGTAAVLTGTDQKKIVDLPNLSGGKNEVIIQKSHRFGYDHAVRNCGVRLVEVESAEDLERAVTERTAMMLFYNNNNSEGRIQDEAFVQLGKKHRIPTMNDAARRCAAGREPVEVHEDGVRPRRVLRREGPSRAAERRPVARTKGSDRRRPPQRATELATPSAAAEGQQGRDARNAGGDRTIPRRRPCGRAAGPSTRAPKPSAAAWRRCPASRPRSSFPEVANHVPHVRVSWDAAAKGLTGERRGQRTARRRAVDRHAIGRQCARHRRVDDAAGR
jgi:L-seryl-tRNA(Ser) seleniumtransferase